MTYALAPPASSQPTQLPAAATEQPFCADLCARVQAIWEAFCACLASYTSQLFTWCITLIHGTGKPVQTDEESQPLAVHPRLCQNQAQWTLVEEYTELMGRGIKNWDGGVYTRKYNYHVYPYALREKMERIELEINQNRFFCLVVNRHYTKTESADDPRRKNWTRIMLELGADADFKHPLYSFTPLHCAVFAGCFLAYRTLREHGADPSIQCKNAKREPEDTPIELAIKIQRSQQTLGDFFWQTLTTDRDKTWERGMAIQALSPWIFRREPEDLRAFGEPFGAVEELAQMIDYEIEQTTPAIHAALDDKLALPLSRLIAHYYI